MSGPHNCPCCHARPCRCFSTSQRGYGGSGGSGARGNSGLSASDFQGILSFLGGCCVAFAIIMPIVALLVSIRPFVCANVERATDKLCSWVVLHSDAALPALGWMTCAMLAACFLGVAVYVGLSSHDHSQDPDCRSGDEDNEFKTVIIFSGVTVGGLLFAVGAYYEDLSSLHKQCCCGVGLYLALLGIYGLIPKRKLAVILSVLTIVSCWTWLVQTIEATAINERSESPASVQKDEQNLQTDGKHLSLNAPPGSTATELSKRNREPAAPPTPAEPAVSPTPPRSLTSPFAATIKDPSAPSDGSQGDIATKEKSVPPSDREDDTRTISPPFPETAPTLPSEPAAARRWTDKSGRKVDAQYIAANVNFVTIRRTSDGNEFDWPFEKLSKADREYVESMITKSEKPEASGKTIAEIREWTDTQGRKTMARLIDVTQDSVKIKRASDGKQFNWPLARLSDVDRQYVMSKITEPDKPKVQNDNTPFTNDN